MKNLDIRMLVSDEGLKYKAVKYSLFEIVDFEADLLYANDKFKVIKDPYKGASYQLEIANPFDRGKMIGGYAYIRFKDSRQNKLFTMSKDEIDAVKSKAQNRVIIRFIETGKIFIIYSPSLLIISQWQCSSISNAFLCHSGVEPAQQAALITI